MATRKMILTLAALILSTSAKGEVIGSGMSDRTRYDGAAYSVIGVAPGRPEQCREACRGDLRCVAWNYQRPDGGASRCELLSNVPKLVWDDAFISGEIGRSQPRPDADERVVPRTPPAEGSPAPSPYAPGDSDGRAFWNQFDMQEGFELQGPAAWSSVYEAKGDAGLTRCATFCADSKECRGFVVRPDSVLAPPPLVLCEIKTAPGRLMRNPAAWSGVKR